MRFLYRMNWYKIEPCPKYAISEDGTQVKNIISNRVLKHNTASYAKDGLRRVTLRRDTTYRNKTFSKPVVYTIEELQKYIKDMFKI